MIDNKGHLATPSAPNDPLESIELVIFDCDGVLIDSEPIASSTLAASMRSMGIEITDGEAHEKYTGNAVRIIRAMIEQEYAFRETDRLFARWLDELYAAFMDRLEPMPGIVDVVRGLARPKCVASNSTMERLRLSLGHLELWNCFSLQIFSADAVPMPKPAPDLMLYCADKFSANPAHCVMIDDSPHGIEAALAAGMVGIGFVDPKDPRPRRSEILFAAGALAVAKGAGELPAALAHANRVLASRRSVSIEPTLSR